MKRAITAIFWPLGMHLANLDYWKCKNGTIDQDMCQNRREEKHGLVNATGVLD